MGCKRIVVLGPKCERIGRPVNTPRGRRILEVVRLLRFWETVEAVSAHILFTIIEFTLKYSKRPLLSERRIKSSLFIFLDDEYNEFCIILFIEVMAYFLTNFLLK